MRAGAINLAIITLIICFSRTASAADQTLPNNPKKLHILDRTGAAYVHMPARGCAKDGFYQLDPEHPKYDAIFNMLLEAQLAKRHVIVRFEGCGKLKKKSYGRIIGVILQ